MRSHLQAFETHIHMILGTILLVFILLLMPFPEGRLSQKRLESAFQQDEQRIRHLVKKHCDTLTAEGRQEVALAKKLFPSSAEDARRRCDLTVESSSVNRFQLVTYTQVGVRIDTPEGQTLFEKTYPLVSPTPLVLLPIALFFMALFFDFPYWSLAATTLSFFALVFGLNFKHLMESLWNFSKLVLYTDKLWMGLSILVAFYSLARKRVQSNEKKVKLSPSELQKNRGMLAIIGLWNPFVFTFLALVTEKITSSLKRLRTFFEGQIVISALSLYLLSTAGGHSLQSLISAIALPRYFSFAIFLSLIVIHSTTRSTRIIPIWTYLTVKRHFAWVVLFEVAAYFIKELKLIPTLTRVALMLLLAELSLSSQTSLVGLVKEIRKPLLYIFLSALISVLCLELGLMDLALLLCDPQAHPTAYVLFTYFSGLFLGVLVGNFSAAFFILVAHLPQMNAQPIVRAALLDGILAGYLLSPFSVQNLIPSAFANLGVGEVIRYRFKLMWVPMVIGGIIFAVSAVNSVAILRPVTFVFLCLLTGTIQLKRAKWRMTRAWPWETRIQWLKRLRY